MDGIEHFSAEKNWARVVSGLHGGNFYQGPVNVPTFKIIDGVPAEVQAKLNYGPIEQPTPIDTWNQRRPNAGI